MMYYKVCRTTLFFAFIMFLTIASFGQSAKINAKITDEKGLTVSYANILFINAEKGMAANADGSFTLSLSNVDMNDSLEVSAIGYEKTFITVANLVKEQVVILRAKNYKLFEIAVSASDAENMVKHAIDRIQRNYPQEPYFIEGFYRQFHRENGKAARLIEASLNIYDQGYIHPNSLLLKEQFEFLGLRRSKVFEKNGFVHDDHLVDLLKQNIVHYPRETILNNLASSYFRFEKDENHESEKTTLIKFFYQNPSDPKTRWGNLLIGNDDYGILRYQENTTKNEDYNPRLKASNNSERKFFEGKITVTYKPFAGKYYLDSISLSYRHNIVSKVFGSTDFTVDEYFNLWTGKIDTVDVPSGNPGKNFHKTGNLYMRKYTYDKRFWDEDELLFRHPLNPAIAAELGKQQTLEEQFIKNGGE